MAKTPTKPPERTPSTPGPKPKLEHSEALIEQIRALGKIQATVEETASVLRVSERTLQNFFTAHPDAKEAHDEGKSEGRASLRRAQFTSALNGNATMQIWLGKQLLGQREPIREIEVGKPGDFAQLDDEALNAVIWAEFEEIQEIERASLPAPDPVRKVDKRKGATKH